VYALYMIWRRYCAGMDELLPTRQASMNLFHNSWLWTLYPKHTENKLLPGLQEFWTPKIKSPLTHTKASEDHSTTTVATAVPKQQNSAGVAFEYTFGGLIEAALTTLALPLVGLVLVYFVWSNVYWVDIASTLLHYWQSWGYDELLTRTFTGR
jgi:hypothetical protein